MPPPVVNNTTFKDQLLNKQTVEQALTLKLTNFNLQIKSIDDRLQKVELLTKSVIDQAQSSISKLINSVFKSNPIIKDEVISEDDIKAEIQSDNKKIETDIKTKTEKCNTGVCDKIKLFKSTIQKSLSNTVSFLGDVIGGKYFSSNSNLISKFFTIAKNSIKTFFGNTVGKLFDWVSEKGGMVVDILSKLISPITSVLKWLSSGAMTIIENLYDKFTMLAKIGWKVISSVWEFFSEKTKTVVEFFKDVFMELITSPIGFILAVGAFILAINYVIKPAIKFIIDVGKFMWDWILKSVDKLFFNNDAKKRELFFETQKKNIKEFLNSLWKDWLKPAYNNTIGKLTGMTTDKLSTWFEPDGLISQYWNDAKSLFLSVINTKILDDIPFIFNGLKDLWDAIDYISDDSSVELFTEKQRKKSLGKENAKILETTTIDQLNSLAESIVFEKLFTFYNENNKNWKTNEESIQNLNKEAKNLYKKFKNNMKLSKNENENQKYISMIDIDLNGIVNTIIGDTHEQTEKILTGNKFKILLAGETFKELKQYYEHPERNINLSDALQEKLIKLNSDNFSKLVLEKEKEISKLSYTPTMIIPKEDIIKAIKNLNQLNLMDYDSSFKYIYERYIKLENNVLTLFQKTTENKNINYVEPLELQNYKPYKTGGIIAQYPTKVLIAEAGSPELIVPINDEGIKFLTDSLVNVLNEDLYKQEKEETKDSGRDSIIKRIRNFKPKPDQKLYDMRNISHGVVGVNR